jgi:hypothetical protein
VERHHLQLHFAASGGGVLDRANSTSQPALEHQGKGEACATGGAGGRHHVRNTRDKQG